MDELLRRIHAEVASNPPLGYEPDEAAALFFKAAKQEVAASREEVSGCWAVHAWAGVASMQRNDGVGTYESSRRPDMHRERVERDRCTGIGGLE
jgi:hypothetical protein